MLLTLDHLTARLPGTARPLLDDVSLRLAAGEVVGLVGESGSGKSTTAKAALGLLPGAATASGTVRVDDTDVLVLTGEELRRHRARTVAMIHQDPRAALNPVRRIGDFLRERGADRTRAAELLDSVGLSDPERRLRQRPHEFSGGMLQRVVIAGALAARPRLLLADEATSALDVTTQAEILALLRTLRAEQGAGLLFITHDLHLAAAYCDRVYVMYAGRIVEERTATAFFAAPAHPYTRGLLDCSPTLGDTSRALLPIPGRPPSLGDVFPGCGLRGPLPGRRAGLRDVAARGRGTAGRGSVGVPPHPGGPVRDRPVHCRPLRDRRVRIRRVRDRRCDRPVRDRPVRDRQEEDPVSERLASPLSESLVSDDDGALLVVERLRKTYPLPGRGRLTAADDVSFAVAAGGSLGIVGESGSGKTTVARMLVGLVRPDAGTVTVDGHPRPPHAPRRKRARLARAREIQMVFQDPYVSLDPRLTAAQCLRTTLRLHGRDEQLAASLLERVGLGEREADARPRQLSGGQRQRLAIARALAVQPRVLVLDEAVAALDVSIQAQILQLLDTIRRDTGVALVFVSHDLAVVQHITDDVLVMRRGSVVEQGPTREVLTEPAHEYTELLLAAVPREGWDPRRAVPARA